MTEKARALLASRRICIIGPPASGKTTFARRLGGLLQMPVLQMDDIYDLCSQAIDGRGPDECFDTILNQVLLSDWLITEGFYSHTVERRVRSADVVIYFRINTFICFFSAIKRSILNLFIETTAHPSTRSRLTARIRFFINPALLRRILKFYRSYEKMIDDMVEQGLCKNFIIVASRREGRELLEKLT